MLVAVLNQVNVCRENCFLPFCARLHNMCVGMYDALRKSFILALCLLQPAHTFAYVGVMYRDNCGKQEKVGVKSCKTTACFAALALWWLVILATWRNRNNCCFSLLRRPLIFWMPLDICHTSTQNFSLLHFYSTFVWDLRNAKLWREIQRQILLFLTCFPRILNGKQIFHLMWQLNNWLCMMLF